MIAQADHKSHGKIDGNQRRCWSIICWSGRTPLQAAVEWGYLHIVDRLLRSGAVVNAPVVEVSSQTALQAAAQEWHIDVVELFLVVCWLEQM